MYCLEEIKERYFKIKEEQNVYEKKNHSGIALRGATANLVG